MSDNKMYWRYKSSKKPKDENEHLNGEVKVVIPAKFKLPKTPPKPKKYKMNENRAKIITDYWILNHQLAWLRDERP